MAFQRPRILQAGVLIQIPDEDAGLRNRVLPALALSRALPGAVETARIGDPAEPTAPIKYSFSDRFVPTHRRSDDRNPAIQVPRVRLAAEPKIRRRNFRPSLPIESIRPTAAGVGDECAPNELNSGSVDLSGVFSLHAGAAVRVSGLPGG